MGAYLIIIFQVRQEYVAEVPLSEHNNVVKAFPSDRSDGPFGISILPRGAWRRWSVANAHRSKSSDEDIAIGPPARSACSSCSGLGGSQPTLRRQLRLDGTRTSKVSRRGPMATRDPSLHRPSACAAAMR